MSFPSIPHHSIMIDSSFSNIAYAAQQACSHHSEKERLLHKTKLQHLWTSESNPNHVLPCLCVRSAFDLFLRVKAFPPYSEVIMSAVNIPDMAKIVRHHKLKVVSCDIDLDNFEPDTALMEKLITPRTVAILVAHLCGRWIEMNPIIAIAQKYGLVVIEDCAESFCGFSRTGHPQSDLALFSFGLIKFITSFGGGIAKVKDTKVFNDMHSLHSQYPIQSSSTYLKKVLKYFIMYTLIYVTIFPKMHQSLRRRTGFEVTDTFVSYVRGFPNELIKNIRHQPCTALLSVMDERHHSFDKLSFDLQRTKAEYFISKVNTDLHVIGTKVNINNFWLFPVLTKTPDVFVKCFKELGVEAYRGTTQLEVVESDDADCEIGPNVLSGEYISARERYPNNAKYFSDHVVYLPINKFVPFYMIEQISYVCRHVTDSLKKAKSDSQAVSICQSLLKAKL